MKDQPLSPSTLLSMDELSFLLPMEWYANELFPDNDAERADVDALLAALAAGNPPPPNSSPQRTIARNLLAITGIET